MKKLILETYLLSLSSVKKGFQILRIARLMKEFIHTYTDDGIDEKSRKKKALVDIVPHEECKKLYSVVEYQLCAGGGADDSCHGDSGGPLMVFINESWYQIGIVSYGADVCALHGSHSTP